jgi:hypothetical protein
MKGGGKRMSMINGALTRNHAAKVTKKTVWASIKHIRRVIVMSMVTSAHEIYHGRTHPKNNVCCLITPFPDPLRPTPLPLTTRATVTAQFPFHPSTVDSIRIPHLVLCLPRACALHSAFVPLISVGVFGECERTSACASIGRPRSSGLLHVLLPR